MIKLIVVINNSLDVYNLQTNTGIRESINKRIVEIELTPYQEKLLTKDDDRETIESVDFLYRFEEK